MRYVSSPPSTRLLFFKFLCFLLLVFPPWVVHTHSVTHNYTQERAQLMSLSPIIARRCPPPPSSRDLTMLHHIQHNRYLFKKMLCTIIIPWTILANSPPHTDNHDVFLAANKLVFKKPCKGISANTLIIGFLFIFSPSDNSPLRKHDRCHQIKYQSAFNKLIQSSPLSSEQLWYLQ